MGFLDNSGDIILDAVLTDTGRFRLARGDGTFKIAKFALGDDEIDYALYNKDHTSGSAYYDLNVLRTPVFEAFTNNTSLLKSKLVTISRTNLLYMPVIRINENAASPTNAGAGTNSRMYSTSATAPSLNTFLILVDDDTFKDTALQPDLLNNNVLKDGIINGTAGAVLKAGGFIRMDQGLDTSEIAPNQTIDPDLRETQYLIEMDDRLGKLTSAQGTPISFNFRDDDFIASYYVAEGDNVFVFPNNNKAAIGLEGDDGQIIKGPRGSILEFKVQATNDLRQTNFLFEKLGSQDTADKMSLGQDANSQNVLFIDSTVRVTGLTTGFRVDVPIRYIKKQ